MADALLVVDDEPQMLIALEETLRRRGYAVTTAGSGAEALLRLKERRFQAVLTDMRMPEVGGLDLLRKVRATSPDTPVILLTAYGTVESAVDAMKHGAFDYLLKPFSSESLEAVVARALRDRAPRGEGGAAEIVTRDPELLAVLERARQAAVSGATVLIEAESGTGKELLARRIHRGSPRGSQPLVAVNCAALPENLLESELFGFERGAFTGAVGSKPGKFELAHRGTLLLDEIGEMAPILQAKLLRVLQEREVDRIGGKEPVKIDVRVIATTNRDLAALVRRGEFREDLYYRLNVIPLSIPPLRRRADDIPLLAELFCQRYGREFGREGVRCGAAALEALGRHRWPGNVRELENTIQRAVALSAGPVIEVEDLMLAPEPAPAGPAAGDHPESPTAAPTGGAGVTVREMERQLIRSTLDATGGNRTHAARILGISLRTLRNKLNEFGLQDRQARFAQSRVQV
jgi:DNA-binding NtrC family response regulator